MACRAMARIHAREDDPRGVQRWLARADENAARRESAHEQAVNVLCKAEIALDQRQDRRAGQLLDAVMPQFVAMGMHWHRERSALLLQRL